MVFIVPTVQTFMGTALLKQAVIGIDLSIDFQLEIILLLMKIIVSHDAQQRFCFSKIFLSLRVMQK